MGLNANAIVNLEQLRDYLGKSLSDIGSDDLMTAAVNAASDTIERYTRRAFKERTIENEIYDGKGKHYLDLLSTPVISLKGPATSDVQWRPAPDRDWEDLESEIRFIMIKPAQPWRISLWRLTFFSGSQNIKVSYKAGYATIPSDVQLVCLEMAAIKFKESGRGDGRLGRTSISNTTSGVATTDSFSDLEERHRRLLARYRWAIP